ncbi:MAG: monovalent cation/H+ antiporter complex subunit F [Thermodesulfobacteriota bacterium]|nr:MAG: monovalent cation/H+ antiporter complex subunit F [Thermodesulfobacteriota bacterium]
MDRLFFALAVFLILNILAGLYRVLRGPTRADRMLAFQLFGTTGVAALLLLSEAAQEPMLRDIALVFALLSVITSAGFARTVRGRTAPGGAADDRG